jgi:hypothetical protein
LSQLAPDLKTKLFHPRVTFTDTDAREVSGRHYTGRVCAPA